MIIKLLPNQIPFFWEAIKFATKQADEVESNNMQPYFNELLHALLSNKAQCYVYLNNDRILVGLLITRLKIDRITKDKFLFIQAVYAWRLLSDQVWRDTYNMVRSFATNEDCKYLLFNSSNPAIWGRTEKLGFKEITRTFSLKIV